MATTWKVSFINFSFNPATVSAVAGDVIQFDLGAAGLPTTTYGSGLPGMSLPPGALEWDEEISISYNTFRKTVTVADNYLYGCMPHFAAGMKGNIIVSSPSPVKFVFFTIFNNKRKAYLEWNTYSASYTDYFSEDGISFMR